MGFEDEVERRMQELAPKGFTAPTGGPGTGEWHAALVAALREAGLRQVPLYRQVAKATVSPRFGEAYYTETFEEVDPVWVLSYKGPSSESSGGFTDTFAVSTTQHFHVGWWEGGTRKAFTPKMGSRMPKRVRIGLPRRGGWVHQGPERGHFGYGAATLVALLRSGKPLHPGEHGSWSQNPRTKR